MKTDMPLSKLARGYVWQKYINYLYNWLYEHEDGEFCGMSPASFDEWLANEEAENED
jgi:hypothetical protein